MKKKSKLARYGGIFFIFIFVALMFVVNTGILNQKYEKILNTANFPVVYSKDKTLFVAPLNKESNSLSDFLVVENETPVVNIADNGNAIYFLENYDNKTKAGSLFVTYDGKEKEAISGKAFQKMYISYDGKVVLYAENPDLEKGCAKLFMYEKGGKKTQISENVLLSSFYMDKETENIFYIEYMPDSEGGDLYVRKEKQVEKIDSGVFEITEVLDGKNVTYIKHSKDNDYALYYWKKSKQPEKLADSIVDFKPSSIDTETFMWCSAKDESGAELNVYDKKIKTLDTGVANILECDPSRSSVLYTKNFSRETYEYDVNLIYKGKESQKIASSKGNVLEVASSRDFKQTAYITDGKLYIKEMGAFAEKEPILVAENVESFKLSEIGNSIAYVVDNMLYLKTGDKVAAAGENVAEYKFTPNGDALCYLANYNVSKQSGNLFMKKTAKPESDPAKIDSDVKRNEFHARNAKNVVYIKNYNNETGEGELCVSRNGKVKTVDKGKITILCEKY